MLRLQCFQLLLFLPFFIFADHPPEKKDLEKGHSNHGGVFNEGPRQAAYLMKGTGELKFEISSKNELTKKFFLQGLGQLHGFWYFEAERSFRQAAVTDKDCAILYWGMAQANIDNQVRARGFLLKAWELKDKASERERLYIEAFASLIGLPTDAKGLEQYKKEKAKFKPKGSDMNRRKDYVRKLEDLVIKYPDDLEAKAFLVVQLWFNGRKGIPVASTLAVNALIDQVLAKAPMHPIHHYRIHHWDYRKSEMALSSAAKCGFSAPSIAHMWHMPGHIYSKQKRFADAAWHQEASARIDHYHMIKDQIMPDQIHNYAHNNEWLTRNLMNLGRLDEAMALAKNMIELPRHPKYNSMKKRGSTLYGRRNLINLLTNFELWQDALNLSETIYLEETEIATEQLNRLRLIGRAHYALGNLEEGKKIVEKVKALSSKIQADKEKQYQESLKKYKEELKKKPKKKPRKPTKSKSKNKDEKLLDTILIELDLARSLAEGGAKETLAKYTKKLAGINKSLLVHLYLAAGQFDSAIKISGDDYKRSKGTVRAAAMQVYTLYTAKKEDEAKKVFNELRKISEDVDLNFEVFRRLSVIAKSFGYPKDWRLKRKQATDILERPKLTDLGPFRWTANKAKKWTLPDHLGKPISLEKENASQAILLIFYLGADCLHCVEQINAFAPKAEAYKKEGIKIIAVSLEDVKSLRESVTSYSKDGSFPFTIVSDAKLDIFKQYRAYDDFEKMALHGTFLIDKDGYIRWQDISFEPFTKPDFLLKESVRLLNKTIENTDKLQ